MGFELASPPALAAPPARPPRPAAAPPGRRAKLGPLEDACAAEDGPGPAAPLLECRVAVSQICAGGWEGFEGVALGFPDSLRVLL